MTKEEIIASLQEEPAGKPWESEAVRTWEPRPFNREEYDRWAADVAREAIIT